MSTDTTRNRFSSNAVILAEKKSIRRFYDGDMDYIDARDRKDTKAYALEILAILKKRNRWISGPELRRRTGPERVRLWEVALSLLCDEVETKNVLIPHFRYSKREVKKPLTRSEANSAIFGLRHDPKLKRTL